MLDWAFWLVGRGQAILSRGFVFMGEGSRVSNLQIGLCNAEILEVGFVAHNSLPSHSLFFLNLR